MKFNVLDVVIVDAKSVSAIIVLEEDISALMRIGESFEVIKETASCRVVIEENVDSTGCEIAVVYQTGLPKSFELADTVKKE